MATATAMGRCLFALGAYLANSIWNYGVHQIGGRGGRRSESILTTTAPSLSSSAATTRIAEKEKDNNERSKGEDLFFFEGREEGTRRRRGGDKTAAAERDRVRGLPGLSSPSTTTSTTTKQYAGYLDASKTRHAFYWYVESQNDPDRDPVVLWTK